MNKKFLALIALVPLTVGAATAADKPDKGQLFTVPFVYNDNAAEATTTITFNLKQPAVLESYSIYCSGASLGSLNFDGGPLGANGTTSAKATISPSSLVQPLEFATQNGTSFLGSPVHVGVPVNASYSFTVSTSVGFSFFSCQGYVILRTL